MAGLLLLLTACDRERGNHQIKSFHAKVVYGLKDVQISDMGKGVKETKITKEKEMRLS